MLNQSLPDAPNLKFKREYEEEQGEIVAVDIDKYQGEPSKISSVPSSIDTNIDVDESRIAFIKYSLTDPEEEKNGNCKVEIVYDNFQAKYKKVYEEYFVETDETDSNRAYHKIDPEQMMYSGTDFKIKDEIDSEELTVKVQTDCFEEDYKDVLHGQLIEQKTNDILNSNTIELEFEEEEDFKLEIEKNIKSEFGDYLDKPEDTLLEKFEELDENFDSLVVDGTTEFKKNHESIGWGPEKRKFSCETCQFSTNVFSNLTSHQAKHENRSKLVCDICQKVHNQAYRLERHMFSHLESAVNIRELDPVEICSKLGVKIRITADLKGKEYSWQTFKCVKCNYLTLHSNGFYRHIQAKHQNGTSEFCMFSSTLEADLQMRFEKDNNFLKEFTCTECNITFYKKDELKIHIELSHDNNKKFKCDICDFSSNLKEDLKGHMSSVHLEECHLCEYKAKYKSDLSAHISSVHFKGLKFECRFCEYKAMHKCYLDRHMSSVHLNERKYECKLCPYKANLKTNLEMHMSSIHLKERKYECKLCSYKANRKSHLDMHLSSLHMKELECQLCKYKTNRRSSLKEHISSVHLKDREFQCRLCEYKTNQKSHLNTHISSIHLKERNFECHLCEYKTNKKSNLTMHISSVHLKERNFECHVCDYKSSYRSSLKKHISSIHFKERKFECHLCEYKANQKSNLDKHMSSVHLKPSIYS